MYVSIYEWLQGIAIHMCLYMLYTSLSSLDKAFRNLPVSLVRIFAFVWIPVIVQVPNNRMDVTRLERENRSYGFASLARSASPPSRELPRPQMVSLREARFSRFFLFLLDFLNKKKYFDRPFLCELCFFFASSRFSIQKSMAFFHACCVFMHWILNYFLNRIYLVRFFQYRFSYFHFISSFSITLLSCVVILYSQLPYPLVYKRVPSNLIIIAALLLMLFPWCIC